jgi:N-acetylmuramoyl-L-alanine amidase
MENFMSRCRWALAIVLAGTFLISLPATAAQGLYTVRPGDTLWEIARKYGTEVQTLKELNGLSANLIRPGQELKLPAEAEERSENARLYVVRRGDTLWHIARRYGTTVQALKDANRLATNRIYPGQRLRLPPPKETTGINDPDFYWLVRVISAEAKGEPLLGQIAVGAVVLNRVKSPRFPDTITDVIFQPGQFTVVADGSIYREPVQSAYTAARLALSGYDPTGGSLYFYNPKTASRSNWIRTRPVVRAIGRHLFAS